MENLFSSFEEGMNSLGAAESIDAFSRSLKIFKDSLKARSFVMSGSEEGEFVSLVGSRLLDDKQRKSMLH